jgi:hypothetical protein
MRPLRAFSTEPGEEIWKAPPLRVTDVLYCPQRLTSRMS